MKPPTAFSYLFSLSLRFTHPTREPISGLSRLAAVRFAEQTDRFVKRTSKCGPSCALWLPLGFFKTNLSGCHLRGPGLRAQGKEPGGKMPSPCDASSALCSALVRWRASGFSRMCATGHRNWPTIDNEAPCVPVCSVAALQRSISDVTHPAPQGEHWYLWSLYHQVDSFCGWECELQMCDWRYFHCAL